MKCSIIFVTIMFVLQVSKIITNFFSLGGVQAISSLIQLLVIPYTISVIGVDGFGIVAVAQVVVLLLSAFTDYGFNQTAVRDISIHRMDRAALSVILFRVLFSKLLLCLVALVILLILIAVVPMVREHYVLYLMGFVFVIGQALLVNWFFQGMERMAIAAALALLARIFFAVLVFSFIRRQEDARLFLFFLGIGTFAAGITSLYIATRFMDIRYTKIAIRDIATELLKGWPLMIANLSAYGSQYVNIIILRIFTNDFIAGYYGIAERIFFTLRQVLVVYSQSVYPQLCQVVQGTKEQLLLFWRKVYLPFLIFIGAGALLLFLFAGEVLAFFVGEAYQNSVLYLQIFAAVTVIVSLNIPATLMLLAMDQKKRYSAVITLALVLNVLFNIVLVNLWEAQGTITTIVFTEVFILAGLNFHLYRTLRLPADLKPA